jgi:hypothetical protein
LQLTLAAAVELDSSSPGTVTNPSQPG